MKRAPVLVMCFVFTLQFVTAKHAGLSPWKGGGFGMFSTMDSTSTRFIHAYGVTDGGKTVFLDNLSEVSAKNFRLAAQHKSCLSWPDQSFLINFANSLLEQRYVKKIETREVTAKAFAEYNSLDLETVHSPTDLEKALVEPFKTNSVVHSQLERLSLRSVTLEIWRLNFDHATKSLTTEILLNSTASND